MLSINPEELETREVYQYLIGAVAPRPIAFASTVDEEGNQNLAPYSFFNVFSSNPPIAVFSSNRRAANNTTKDTYHNILKTKEVVINVVNYDIVRQMAISAIEYPTDVNEFDKTGLTPLASEVVKAPRVAESPVQMECIVEDIVTLGKEGGAGHLMICKIVRLHIDEKVLDERGRIDPHKIDLVGRMGRAHYVRASGKAIFPVVQPILKEAIGFDALPKWLLESNILTGNELAQLAGLETLPSLKEVEGLKFPEGVDACEFIKNLIHNGYIEDASKFVVLNSSKNASL